MKNMQAKETIVDSSLRETKLHGTPEFPLGVYFDDFSNFENGYICWHWHEEVQISHIIEGEFICQVENHTILLKPGDMVFINSGILHQIRPCKPSFGKLHAFIWKVDFISGDKNGTVYQTAFQTMLRQKSSFFYYQSESNEGMRIGNQLNEIISDYTKKPDYYALHIKILLSEIWLQLCKDMPNENQNSDTEKPKDEERVKLALTYMQNHYSEKFSLSDIAREALTSRSELCRCFQRTLNTSPKEFLMQFRIRQATALLKNPAYRISDIAEITGFSSPSHFGTYFSKYVGCSPREYRSSGEE